MQLFSNCTRYRVITYTKQKLKVGVGEEDKFCRFIGERAIFVRFIGFWEFRTPPPHA